MNDWMNRDDYERARRRETALAKMERLFPTVWHPAHWLWEAAQLGVVMAGLTGFVVFVWAFMLPH